MGVPLAVKAEVHFHLRVEVVEVDVVGEVEDVVLIVLKDDFNGFDVTLEEIEGVLLAGIDGFLLGEGLLLEDFLVDITMIR